MQDPDKIAKAVLKAARVRAPAAFLVGEAADVIAAALAEERERAIKAVEAKITDLVSRMNSDNEEYYSAVCFHLHQLAAAIRA